MVARQREDADGGEASAAFRHVSVPHVDKEKFQSNLLITSKYSAFNFLPIALGEQCVRHGTRRPHSGSPTASRHSLRAAFYRAMTPLPPVGGRAPSGSSARPMCTS